MAKVSDESFQKALKPFDVVTDKDGNVGIIREVDVNECQESFEHQISYAVSWLTGKNTQTAWFHHNELTYHCNVMVRIAEAASGGHGGNYRYVKKLFKHM